jgi:hypothetical protein
MDGHRAATTREPPHRIRLTGRLTVTTQVRALYRRPVTRGHKLLADIKAVFGDADRMATADLLERLAAIDEAPWGDWYDKPIDARWLTRRLKPFGVNSTNVRIGESSIRGYLVEDLMDVRARYLPDPRGERNKRNKWNTAHRPRPVAGHVTRERIRQIRQFRPAAGVADAVMASSVLRPYLIDAETLEATADPIDTPAEILAHYESRDDGVDVPGSQVSKASRSGPRS